MLGLFHSPAVPPGLSMRECGATGSASHHLVGSPSCSLACCLPQSTTLESSLPWLPISASPSGLDECFFFISLVAGLPYSSIFCQFWLFFVFKLLLSFWLCEEAQCVYLRLHLGRKPPSNRFLIHCSLSCTSDYDEDVVMLHVVPKVS